MLSKYRFAFLFYIFIALGSFAKAEPVKGQANTSKANSLPAIKTDLFFNAGASLLKEKDMEAAFALTKAMGLTMAFGSHIGPLIKSGFFWQEPSNYTEYWYRYRGFFGLSLAGGFKAEKKPFAFSLAMGGLLARYNLSYSYFWFPFVEAGLSYTLFDFSDGFSLAGTLTLPVFFRRDAPGIGLNLGLSVSYKNKAGRAQK